MESALVKTTIFSGFLSTMLLTFLSYAANPRAIVVKCDGSVYGVDIDIVLLIRNIDHKTSFLCLFLILCKHVCHKQYYCIL